MKKITIFSIVFSMLVFFNISLSIAGQDAANTLFSSRPVFTATSTDPVLLRYKFKVGQIVNMEFEMASGSHMQAEGMNVEFQTIMKIFGNYKVTSVNSRGDAGAILNLTRMTVQVKGQNNVSFDSNDPGASDNPNFKEVMAMLHVPIPVKVSSRGEVIDMNLDPLNQAYKKAGIALNKSEINKTTSKTIKSSFVQLAEHPVKAGDIYDAGVISEPFPGGIMNARSHFKVLAVSKDKSKVLLAPVSEFDLKSTPDSAITITLNSSKMEGWLLFDRKRGNIDRSWVSISLDATMKQNAQKAKIQWDTELKGRVW